MDAFGEGLLTGDPPAVDERLRTDLRVRVDPGDYTCQYRLDHTRREPALRAYGSFVTTIVDGLDERLRSWGVDPPPAYEYVDTVDGWHRYEGVLSV